MHPNPVFHTETAERNLSFARARGFGVLAISIADAPVFAHVPFLLNEEGSLADLHLLRSNPIARALKTPQTARIAVSGPDTYVSPDWYEVPDQVPTWNYIAVQLTGTLRLCPADELHAMLDRQSAAYENRLAPKAPWTTSKMTPEVMERMMRTIVPCAFEVTGVDGTWKLNQNKPDKVRLRAADQVAEHGFGSETARIAEMMRKAGTDAL